MDNNKRTLQKKATVRAAKSYIVQAALLCMLVCLCSACGSGGGGGGTAAVVSSNQGHADPNFLIVTRDEYGLLSPNFYYSINNDALWSIQSSIATDIWDPNFRSIIRIDIPKSAGGIMPVINNKIFSVEDNGPYEKFPGTFSVLNGQASVLKKVEQGMIAFTADSNPSGIVSGIFDVILTDYDSAIVPSPQYRIAGMFHFTMGTYGPAIP